MEYKHRHNWVNIGTFIPRDQTLSLLKLFSCHGSIYSMKLCGHAVKCGLYELSLKKQPVTVRETTVVKWVQR